MVNDANNSIDIKKKVTTDILKKQKNTTIKQTTM